MRENAVLLQHKSGVKSKCQSVLGRLDCGLLPTNLWQKNMRALHTHISVLAVLCTIDGQRVTDGEIVHYSFQYSKCAAGSTASFDNILAPTDGQRALTRGIGSECQIERHVGLTLETSCMANDAVSTCGFAPLTGHSGSDIFMGVTAGFTLELWLKPAANQKAVSTNDLLTILSIGSANMTGSDGACSIPDAEGNATVTMRLLQTKQGCLQLQLLVQDDGGELTCRPLFNDAATECDIPHINVSSPALTHVAIAVAANLTSVQPDLPRVAFYVNGLPVMDSERGDVTRKDNFLEHDLNAITSLVGVKLLVPDEVWGGLEHALRLGYDGVTVPSPDHEVG